MQEELLFLFEMGNLTAKVRTEIDHHTAKPIREEIGVSCPKCGTRMKTDCRYCPRCGEKR